MALKRRNKASAEFSMASLTDVIFLLLIFFVLTSKLVQPTPFELPESDSKTVAPVTVIVQIDENGKMLFEGKPVNTAALESAIRRKIKQLEKPEDFTITIAAYKDIAFDNVVDVIEIAGKLRVKAILATQPKQT